MNREKMHDLARIIEGPTYDGQLIDKLVDKVSQAEKRCEPAPSPTAQEIVNKIREAIRETGNTTQHVFGQDKGTVRHRIYQVRANADTVEARSIETGKWFVLSGWEVK